MIGDRKWIKSLWFFNGEYDKEEIEVKKSMKKKWMNQVDWNTKHFATPLDTLFKDNVLDKLKLKLPIPEVVTWTE